MVQCKLRLGKKMTKEKKLDIEQLLDSLEGISEQLQSGKLPLNESIELYKEGIEIAKLLDKELRKVDSDIEVLKEQLTNINIF